MVLDTRSLFRLHAKDLNGEFAKSLFETSQPSQFQIAAATHTASSQKWANGEIIMRKAWQEAKISWETSGAKRGRLLQPRATTLAALHAESMNCIGEP